MATAATSHWRPLRNALRGGGDVGLVLLQFEVRLPHLEGDALLCQGVLLLHLAEFGRHFIDLGGG